MNCFLLEKIRYLLFNASLDKLFWAETLVNGSHLMNCLMLTAIGGKISLDIWSIELQDYSLLRIFGCPAYFNVKDDKLNLRVKKFVFWE